MKYSKIAKIHEFSFRDNLGVIYLLCVGILEFLLMAFGATFYYEHKNYLLFPVIMFFGAAFTQNLTPSAKRKLLLGILSVIWFLVIQKYRNNMGWKLYPFSWFPAIYLMAYLFAAVTQDAERIKGLKTYSGCFLGAAAVLVCYGVILLLGRVPKEYSLLIYLHEETRFALMWNPNITGCIFFVAVSICLLFYVYYKRKWIRFLFFFLGFVYFINLILTNSRTIVIYFCFMAGGISFFYFIRKGKRKIIFAIVAALLTFVGTFLFSEAIYNSHRNRLIAQYSQQLEEATDPSMAVSNLVVDPDGVEKDLSIILGLTSSIDVSSGEKGLSFSKRQLSNKELESRLTRIDKFKENRSLLKQFGTLSGRTLIWRAALRAIREDPSILWWGCEHVGDTISLYTEKSYMHSHNSWIEITMSLGLPGLIIALIYTWIAVWNSMVLLWNKLVPLWKKTIALLVLGLLVAGFMEPYLFFSNQFFHFIDFTFFLCLGYVRVWVEALPRKFDTKKFPFCLL